MLAESKQTLLIGGGIMALDVNSFCLTSTSWQLDSQNIVKKTVVCVCMCLRGCMHLYVGRVLHALKQSFPFAHKREILIRFTHLIGDLYIIGGKKKMQNYFFLRIVSCEPAALPGQVYVNPEYYQGSCFDQLNSHCLLCMQMLFHQFSCHVFRCLLHCEVVQRMVTTSTLSPSLLQKKLIFCDELSQVCIVIKNHTSNCFCCLHCSNVDVFKLHSLGTWGEVTCVIKHVYFSVGKSLFSGSHPSCK